MADRSVTVVTASPVAVASRTYKRIGPGGSFASPAGSSEKAT